MTERLSTVPNTQCWLLLSLFFVVSVVPTARGPWEKKTTRCNNSFYFFGLKTRPTLFSFPDISTNQRYHFKTRTSQHNFDDPEIMMLTEAQ